MKNVNLKLIGELMKSSRRSDRELAKAVGVSQPTVSRVINRLEREGIIKEYTMIPDFTKLGFQILAVTFLTITKAFDLQVFEKTFKNILMVKEGMGLKYSHMVVSLHEDYSSYADFERNLRQNSWNITDSSSFLVNLNNTHGFFSFSAIAEHIIKK